MGAINGIRVLEIEATARAEDNSPARIVRIAEASPQGRGQRPTGRILRPLVPGATIAAVLIAGIGSLLCDRSSVSSVPSSCSSPRPHVPWRSSVPVVAASKLGVLVNAERR
ncbi:hypothetical protein [Actinophytocola sp. KF-1]